MLNQLRLLRDVFALILIAATWGLWFAASDFPAVPFFRFLTSVPQIVDSVLGGVLVVVLLVDVCLTTSQIVGRRMFAESVRAEQVCDAIFVVTAVGLVLLNQHCLQPWIYHFLLITSLLFAIQPSKPTCDYEKLSHVDSVAHESGEAFFRMAVLWLTASIYVWSAWSKLDAGFLQTHGPKFVAAICDVVGVSTRFWTDQTWKITSLMLPLGELLVGIGLLFSRTRNAALWVSLVMHFALILAVGPWGLNHRSGVLLWNGFFIAQNILLMRAARKERTLASTARQFWGDSRSRIPVLILGAAVLFPAFRSVGGCDTWPAWAVYASSPARVLVQVRENVAGQIPEGLEQYVEPRRVNDGWLWLRIDLWSLEATETPIYPEDRFQLGVARRVAREADLRDGIRIIYEEESDRWTGQRKRFEKVGDSGMAELGKRFLLNSSPR